MTSRTVFPGGSLVRALFHRPLMVLADRGGASGIVGDRWGDHCARYLGVEPPRRLVLPDGGRGTVSSVVRLDTIPDINRFASHHSLSNPDFLIEVDLGGQRVLAAADAKFSVETARAKQVSAEIVSALIAAEGSPIAPMVDVAAPRADGLFLAPDFPLTHEVLGGRFGIGRLTVRRTQVHLVPATSVDLFRSTTTRPLIEAFARIDGYAHAWQDDLMLGLYGLRCAAAAVGCWQDEVRPLLGRNDRLEDVTDRVLAALEGRAQRGRSGWELIQRWDTDAEGIRAQRVALTRAAQLPVGSRELRSMVEEEAMRAGVAEPSLNYVRRRLADLTRDRLLRELGVILPPLDEEGRTLTAVARAASRMARTARDDVALIVGSSGGGSELPE